MAGMTIEVYQLMSDKIEQKAEVLEKEAEEGYTLDVLYRHLHAVDENERAAVARAIETKNAARRKTDGTLPKLEFDGKGDLKAVEKQDQYSSVRVELDEKGQKTSKLEGWPDKSWQRTDYDPDSGHITSVREKHADQTAEERLYDGKTQHPKSVKRWDANQNLVENTEYDSTNGHKKSSFLKNKDNSTSKTEYDSSTEKKTSEKITWTWGAPEIRKYDPPGHLKSDDLPFQDGTTVSLRFDPLSGELTSMDKTSSEGTDHGKARKLESGNIMIEYEDGSNVHVIFDQNHDIQRVIRSNRKGDSLR